MKKVLPTILLLTFLFHLNFLSRIVFSPLLPVIKGDMGIDNTASGSFFLFISSGYFVSIFFSSYVSSFLNHKNTIFLSTFCSGGLIIAFGYVESFTVLRGGLFTLGLAAGLFLPSSLTSITNIIPQRYLARGMSIHELAPNLGFVVAPLFADFLLQWITWREVLQCLGIIMVFVSLVYLFRKEGYKEKGQKIDFQDAKKLLFEPRFLLLVCLFSLAICSTLGIYAMLPLFLVTSHGMEASSANNLLAVSRVSSICMPLLGGWMGDRFGNKLVLSLVLTAAGFLTILLGITHGKMLLLFAILQPMVAVCFFPSGFAVLARLRKDDRGGLAVSLCIPFAFLAGGGCMPTLIGAIGDYASFSLSFFMIGSLMVVGGAFAVFCKSLEY